jgi:hypothetical protein
LAYTSGFEIRNGGIYTPTLKAGFSAPTSGTLIVAKSDQFSFLVPILELFDQFDQKLLDFRANGVMGLSIDANTNTYLNVAASSGARSALRINPGVDPSSLTNGDIWVNNDKMFIRLSGVTKEFQFV